MDKSFNMDKVFFTFNTFFYDFLKDLKSACKEKHPDIRKSIRANYVVKDHASEEHFNHMSSMIDDDMVRKLLSDESIFDVCSNVEFCKGYMLKTYSSDIKSSYIEGYLYIFVLFIHLKRNPIESDKLFELVMKSLGSIQKGTDPSEFISEIVDDEIVKLLEIIKRVLPVAEPEGQKGNLENTKIGKIAEEIAKELDLDGMNLKNPSDILQGNGDLLGKIVSNVSNKLQKKFADGSINQNELLSEAMSVIGGMKDGNGSFNNIFSNMMKSFGAASGSHSSSHVTSRLRNKLKQKKDKM